MSNILPKKSWHVLNAENRERVRRDEELAEETNKVEQETRARHERVSRIEELRKRVGIRDLGVEPFCPNSRARSRPNTCGKPDLEKHTLGHTISLPQERTKITHNKRVQRPWHELGDDTPAKGQEESLAREDPLNIFKKRASKPSSPSYLAVQKAKVRQLQKPRPT